MVMNRSVRYLDSREAQAYYKVQSLLLIKPYRAISTSLGGGLTGRRSRMADRAARRSH
jgi:hypothetical protein